MKKRFILAMTCLSLLCNSCNSDNNTELLNDSQFSTKISQKTSNEQLSITQKIGTIFDKMLLDPSVKKALFSLTQEKIPTYNGATLKGSTFKNHSLLYSDFVTEDHVMLLYNSQFKKTHQEEPNEDVLNNNFIIHSNWVFEDNIIMLSNNDIIENHIMMNIKTVNDRIRIEGERSITFEELFNETSKFLYEDQTIEFNYVMEKYPNLFFSANKSYLSSYNSNMNFPLTNVSIHSTPICNGSSTNPNSVRLTLIKDGENVLNNYYYRTNISSAQLQTLSGVVKATYNAGGTGNLTLDSSNRFFTYTDNNPINTTDRYILVINYNNIIGGTNYFSISTTNTPHLELFMHYETKENLDYSVYRHQQYLHSLNNNTHLVTRVFHGNNEPITLNPWLSKGISSYSLTLTEVSTGITETLTGLNLSGFDFAVDLKSRFNMYIGTNLSPQYIRNEYTLQMVANDCNNTTISKTITFYVDSRARLHP
ncbi:hypothetical protein ACSIGC_15855 [Tenacibaculum sp. ZS6-P6]|uniref:hypothetical protein n=1 Tax=Tenacibaculum sp. ZS6-P6 TaxID=3447503 RepID=UPI003F98BA82